MKLKYKCALCSAEYNLCGFTNHIQRTHKIKYKDYYDAYIDSAKHVCKFCGKPCAFANHRGYYDTCNSDACVRKQQHETMLARYGKSRRRADKMKTKPAIEYAFVCQLCGHGFKNHGMLNRHLIKAHTGITTEEYFLKYMNGEIKMCEICGKPAKWLGTHYHNVCGSPECTRALRSKNNAMNDLNRRKRISETQKSFSMKKKQEINEKRKKTCLQRYGYAHNWASPELREHGYETCETLYGDRNYHNVKQMQKTCEMHFGVRSFSQTAAFHKKKWRKFIKDGIMFDSSYEYAFHNFLNISNISHEYHTGDKFKYIFDNKECFYFPDFKIGETFYEIKSEYLYECMLKSNTKENAKYKCMLDNDVKIIPSCELLDFINAVFAKNITIDEIVKLNLEHKELTSAHNCWILDAIPESQMNEKYMTNAINNVLKRIKKYLMKGVEQSFCHDYIFALLDDTLFVR